MASIRFWDKWKMMISLQGEKAFQIWIFIEATERGDEMGIEKETPSIRDDNVADDRNFPPIVYTHFVECNAISIETNYLYMLNYLTYICCTLICCHHYTIHFRLMLKDIWMFGKHNSCLLWWLRVHFYQSDGDILLSSMELILVYW